MKNLTAEGIMAIFAELVIAFFGALVGYWITTAHIDTLEKIAWFGALINVWILLAGSLAGEIP